MKFKVYEVEHKVTPTGKELKKLVLQREGAQYPDKNVTMWSDHPAFATVAPGQEIEGDLDIKESTVPNPHGGFYKNKTLYPAGKSPAPVNTAGGNPPWVQEFRERLERMERKIDQTLPKTPSGSPVTQGSTDEITVDDIPFG